MRVGVWLRNAAVVSLIAFVAVDLVIVYLADGDFERYKVLALWSLGLVFVSAVMFAIGFFIPIDRRIRRHIKSRPPE